LTAGAMGDKNVRKRQLAPARISGGSVQLTCCGHRRRKT
jgi:hypothetical protein